MHRPKELELSGPLAAPAGLTQKLPFRVEVAQFLGSRIGDDDTIRAKTGDAADAKELKLGVAFQNTEVKYRLERHLPMGKGRIGDRRRFGLGFAGGERDQRKGGELDRGHATTTVAQVVGGVKVGGQLDRRTVGGGSPAVDAPRVRHSA